MIELGKLLCGTSVAAMSKLEDPLPIAWSPEALKIIPLGKTTLAQVCSISYV